MSYAHFKAGWLVPAEHSAERMLTVMLGWFADETGRLSVSNAVIAHVTSMSDRTVGKHLASLAERGYITVKRRGRGKHITLHYDLLDEYPEPDNLGRIECTYCGSHGVPMELDHIVARASGGGNDHENLTVACIACNTDKGALPLEEWRSL